MQLLFRSLSRQLILILCCCFIVVAVTGIVLGIGDRIIELPNIATQLLIEIHQGAFVGKKLLPIYVLLIGLGVSILSLKAALQGGYNFLFQLSHPSIEKVLWIISLIFVIPLMLCVETGVAYRLGTDWFKMSSKQANWFLAIHSGAFWGGVWEVVYILVTGLGLIAVSKAIWQTVNTRTSNNRKRTPRRKTTQDVQYSPEAIDKLYEQEADSITMLKAIPDSMLRMSQDGMCLSYMPAKEAKYFVFHGDIINKHISEFLAPELVVKLIKTTQLSLQTGKTESFQFPILVDGKAKYHEARVTSIGNSEVLILIRENGSMSVVTSEFSVAKNSKKKLRLLSESELVQVLETNRSQTDINRQQVLMCFAIDKTETNNSNGELVVDDNLLHQIAIQIDMLLISNAIFQLEDNLVILVSNRTMEQAVVLVDELNRDLRNFINNSTSDIITAINIRIGLVEINYDNLDTDDLIRGVKATCQMAKHKVNFQTFG